MWKQWDCGLRWHWMVTAQRQKYILMDQKRKPRDKSMHLWTPYLWKVQFSLVTQSCLTLCDPMNRSTPGLPVHHQCTEFTQIHVHRDSDAIQPFHPLSSPFLLPSIPPSIKVFSNESILHIWWPKYWSFSFKSFLQKKSQGWSQNGLVGSPCSPRDFQESSPTP